MKFPSQQYSLIYADPAWSYDMYSEKGHAKSPHAHYKCMTLEEMKALPVIFCGAPNSVLIMWAVFPMIPQALELMEAWGYQFKTGGAWNKLTTHGKPAFGTGYTLRGSSELFLIGTIGSPKIKNHATRNVLFTGDEWPENLRDIGVILNTLRREHSRKPDEMYDVIENLFDGPYLELFARTSKKGWDSWGNETDKF